MTYVVEVSCRATRSLLVKNCHSGAEAKRKARAQDADVENLDFVVDRTCWAAARAHAQRDTSGKDGKT